MSFYTYESLVFKNIKQSVFVKFQITKWSIFQIIPLFKAHYNNKVTNNIVEVSSSLFLKIAFSSKNRKTLFLFLFIDEQIEKNL